MHIDTTTYNKAQAHPSRWGYQARGSAVPSSIIIHTTSNGRPTHFETEARYLLDSSAVSAHYLIGKEGQIVQFLAPQPWQAWHAGTCLPAYTNAKSIGIEHHVSVGESWTAAMHAACTWLVKQLMVTFAIPSTSIDTHRAVALPAGRKKDPAGWGDAAFYAWRVTLDAPPPPRRYRVLGLPVYQESDRNGPLWGHLVPGEEITIDDMANGHLADHRGFIRLDPDTLEAL